MRRILSILIAFPLAVILTGLAVANRQAVPLNLDPLRPESPAIAPLVLPFYVYLLGALILGVAIGGVSTWLSQGRFRRMVRVRSVEATRWRAEADRLTRERDDIISTTARNGGQDRSTGGKAVALASR